MYTMKLLHKIADFPHYYGPQGVRSVIFLKPFLEKIVIDISGILSYLLIKK